MTVLSLATCCKKSVGHRLLVYSVAANFQVSVAVLLMKFSSSLGAGWKCGSGNWAPIAPGVGCGPWDGHAAVTPLSVSPALCAMVATIWFPVCAHRETTIVSFGYSLYAGWIGAVLCLVGGCVIVCCAGDAQAFGENRFYYSSGSSSPTHAKSAHV